MTIMPDLLDCIAKEIGDDAALLVAREWGGRSLYIPQRIEPGHRLAEILGLERAQQLIKMIGHGPIMVPLGPSARLTQIHDLIYRRLREGYSHAHVAREAGVHVRSVERLAAKLRESTQTSLFPE